MINQNPVTSFVSVDKDTVVASVVALNEVLNFHFYDPMPLDEIKDSYGLAAALSADLSGSMSDRPDSDDGNLIERRFNLLHVDSVSISGKLLSCLISAFNQIPNHSFPTVWELNSTYAIAENLGNC